MIWAKYANKKLAENGIKFIDEGWPNYNGRIVYDAESEPYPWLLVVHVRRDSEAMR